jgi:hypothetical protein
MEQVAMAKSLLPPRVVDQISEISTSIMVEGQIEGAYVSIASNGDFDHPIAGDVAAHSTQVFPLRSGVVLTAGSAITAKQSKDGYATSDASPEPVTVQAALNPLPTPLFCSHLYAYPFTVGIDHMTPGAQAEIYRKNALLGRAVNCTGSVGVGVTPSIVLGDTISADQAEDSPRPQHHKSQSVESLPGDVPGADRHIDGDVMKPLLPPKINSPTECDTAILLSDVLDGTLVTIQRESPLGDKKEDLVYSYWGGSWWAPLAKPLALKEKLRAKQEFQKKKEKEALSSIWSDKVSVERAPLTSPYVWGPICARASSAHIENLHPGAILTVKVIVQDASEPVELGIWQVPPRSWHDVPLSKFPDGKGRQLFVTQTFCRQKIDSNKVPIDDVSDDPYAPGLPEKLYACSRTVNVTNIQPGAKVTICSTKLKAPIAQLRVYSDHANIKVCPALIKDDDIWAEQSGCSGKAAKSNKTVHVDVYDALPMPVVQKSIHPFTNPIKVSNLVPGAWVNLWIDNSWLASADASDISVDVYIPIPSTGLKVEGLIKARQSLCANSSESKPMVPVTIGEMKVNVQVDTTATHTFIFGEPCNLTVTAEDVDDNHSVQGDVYVDGVWVARTGEKFGITFYATAPMPIGIIKARGYTDASISWPQPLRQMVLSVVAYPPSVKKGEKVKLIVSAYDMWTNMPVNGTVKIQRYTGPSFSWDSVGVTFQTFEYIWPITYPDTVAVIQVDSDGYASAEFRQIQLGAPLPSNGTLTLTVLSGISNCPGVRTTFKSVDWQISGPNISQAASGDQATISLLVPSGGGTVECAISCIAKFDCEGTLFTEDGTPLPDPKDCIATFVNPDTGAWDTYKLIWSGNEQSRSFVIRYNKDTGGFELHG